MLCDRLVLRLVEPTEEKALAELVADAFGRPDEARLSAALMASPSVTISLVAECDGRLIGHVLVSEIGAPVRAAALAPLSVLPDYREMQVGTALVREAIERARKAGFEAIFVLGETFYYERFGFSHTLAEPFEAEWQGPNFMALELAEGALKDRKGQLVYPPAFLE